MIYEHRVESQRKGRILQKSIPVESLILALINIPAGSRIIVTQGGYYAEGDLATAFLPEKEKEINGIGYYSVGHSLQTY